MSNLYDLRHYRVSEARPDSESELRWARIEAAHEELERVLAETSREVKETTRVARETSRIVGNMGRTQGQVAEEFFYAALREEPCIGNLKFDDVRANFKVDRRGRSAEYDLMMTNGEYVVVVEVKHKLRGRDVEHMREVLAPNFRFLLPEWRDRKLLLAAAYITAVADALSLAREYGYAVLSPDGQKVRADTRCVRYMSFGVP